MSSSVGCPMRSNPNLLKVQMLAEDSNRIELNNMNQGKEGASYVYPNPFVQVLCYMRVHLIDN
jgi:hypothetical protein